MRGWQKAWDQALYGPDGFFVRERPLDHFATSVALPAFWAAVRELASRVDEALGRPDPFDVVDLGAGGGELLAGFGAVPARWRLTAVDLSVIHADPPGTSAPSGACGVRVDHLVPDGVTGLVFANEWLDDVPVPVLEDGRYVLVAEDGSESLGGAASEVDAAWASRWWPGAGRVEVGRPRDLAWAGAVSRVERGLVVAVDYGHTVADRRPTLTGYRAGRQVHPVPDGSCDLTSHVAVDSLGARLMTQRDALFELCPQLTDLERASQVARLRDPAGLGGFWWALQEVGIDPVL